MSHLLDELGQAAVQLVTLSTEMLQQQMQQQNQLITALLHSVSLQNPSAELAMPMPVPAPVPAPMSMPSTARKSVATAPSNTATDRIQVDSTASASGSAIAESDTVNTAVSDTQTPSQQDKKPLKRTITTLKGLLNTITSNSTHCPETQPSRAETSVSNAPETFAAEISTAKTAASTPAPFSLPNVIAASIPSAEQAQCYQALAPLSEAQQSDLFAVFIDMLERDTVRFPSKLFQGLAKRAKQNQLTVPTAKAKSTHPPAAAAQSSYPVPPPRDLETAEQTAQREAYESAVEEQSLRQMLHINSDLQGISPEKLAEKLMLTHLLPV